MLLSSGAGENMDGNAWENIKWVLGGMSAIFSAIALVMWNFILRVQDNIQTAQSDENAKLWRVISENATMAHNEALDQEKRFATKDDVTRLQQHMDAGHTVINERLDNIVDLIIKRNRH
jgi:hypothetical protein